MEALIQKSCFFFLQQVLCHALKKTNHFLVGIDHGVLFVLAAADILTDHADHPDDAHDVIQMFMGDKNSPDLFPVDPGVLQLMQDAVSASAVHQEIVIFFAEYKTGIIALGHCRVSRSKYGKFHLFSSCAKKGAAVSCSPFLFFLSPAGRLPAESYPPQRYRRFRR